MRVSITRVIPKATVATTVVTKKNLAGHCINRNQRCSGNIAVTRTANRIPLEPRLRYHDAVSQDAANAESSMTGSPILQPAARERLVAVKAASPIRAQIAVAVATSINVRIRNDEA